MHQSASSSKTSNRAAKTPLIQPYPKEPPIEDKERRRSSGNANGEKLKNLFTPNLVDETGRTQGGMDFAKLIHTRYLSDKEQLLLTALNEYKRVGYKRTLVRLIIMILVCILLIAFTVVSIGCWSQHLELTENLKVYDLMFVRLNKTNPSSVEMDCPLIGFMEKFWSPQSAHVDLVGKILSIISIRKLMQLIVRLVRSIRLKTTTEEEARQHLDETQKDLNGLAESIVETLCEI